MAYSKKKNTKENKIKIYIITILFAVLILFPLDVINATSLNKTIIDYKNENTDKYETEEIIVVQNKYIGTYEITAYCPCASCCGKSTGITASGAKAQANHTIAADIKILPFNTEVIIDNNKYTVEDVGGGVKGNHIDMYFNTHGEAINFGRQFKKLYIEEEFSMTLIPVEFREYMLITGEMIKKKTADSVYDKETGNVYWNNKAGHLVVSRKKNDKGLFEHRVEENIYNDWLRGR